MGSHKRCTIALATVVLAALAACGVSPASDDATPLDRSQYEIMLRTFDLTSSGAVNANSCVNINLAIVYKGTQNIAPSPEALTGTLAPVAAASTFYIDPNCAASGNTFSIAKDTNGTNAGLKATAGTYSVTAAITGYTLQKALELKVE